MAGGGQEMNHKIKDIHSREELEDFIQKTVGKDAIPELVEKILSLPSGEIITFVCRQYDPVLGHRQQSIRVFHKLGEEMKIPHLHGREEIYQYLNSITEIDKNDIDSLANQMLQTPSGDTYTIILKYANSELCKQLDCVVFHNKDK